MSLYHQDEETRKAIDNLLAKNQALESNLGLDSTLRERTNAKAKQQKRLIKIRELDPDFYDVIEPDRNETEKDRELKEKFK